MNQVDPEDAILVNEAMERYLNILSGKPMDKNGEMIMANIDTRTPEVSVYDLYELTKKNDFLKLYYTWRLIHEAKDILSSVQPNREMNIGNIMPDPISKWNE